MRYLTSIWFVLVWAHMCCTSFLAAQVDCWWDRLYVELAGGSVSGWGTGKPSLGSGIANNLAMNPQCNLGGGIEAKLGYRCSPCWRFDIAYNFLASHYTWDIIAGFEERFGTTEAEWVTADFYAHTAFLNVYMQLPQGNVSPYILGSIGVAWNDLGIASIYISDDFSASAVILAQIASNTTCNCVGRLGLGLWAHITSCFQIDINLSVATLGTVKSGDVRTLLIGPEAGSVHPIIPYTFTNNWLSALQVGVIYTF